MLLMVRTETTVFGASVADGCGELERHGPGFGIAEHFQEPRRIAGYQRFGDAVPGALFSQEDLAVADDACRVY